MLEGHCECRKVSFQVNGEMNQLSQCHCSQSRRIHGAAYGSYACVLKSEFQYLTGSNEVKNYASSADLTRVFCLHCGSNIMAIIKTEPTQLYLAMGLINGNPIIPIDQHHIYVGSKANWHSITDDLPQYDEDTVEVKS